MIEDYDPYIEKLFLNEPWRSGDGDTASPCSGTLTWDGSPFWLCTKCGRVGRTTFSLHYPAESPDRVVQKFFYKLLHALAHRL